MADESENVVSGGKPTSKKKPVEPGIVYLSRVPTLMNVTLVRQTFERYGEIGKIFLQPDGRAGRGKSGRRFSEGWVEFRNKRIAKQISQALNNTQIGGKKKNKWREELWNLKYLHRFKWAHLNEKMAYEKAVHSQRMRTEISQAKREANFYIQNAEKNERISKLNRKKLKNNADGDNSETVAKPDKGKDERIYEFRLKETENEIVKKRKQEGGSKSQCKSKKHKQMNENVSNKSLAGGKTFLTKIFSGGLDTDSDHD